MPDDPLRVLYVSPYAETGGAERTVMDLLALHDRAVVDPFVAFLHDGPLVARCRNELGVRTALIKAPPRARRLLETRRTIRTLSSLIAMQQVDLVHSTMAWGQIFGGRAAQRARVPNVWFQHTPAARRALDYAAALLPTRTIIANSEFTAGTQRQVNPLHRPVRVIYLGTRLSSEPRGFRRRRGRQALGLDTSDFAVGIAGRLQPWKGQDVVLRAAASLIHARPRARLFVIGGALFGLDGDYEGTLRRLAAELGIADRTVFTGHREDVGDCLAGLDVAVHASVEPEAFGLVLVEAMAARTALVAADAGAAREIVTHGTDGLLVPPGDPEALAVALLALCDDPDRRARLASAGEATARRRFDAREMTRKIEELYTTLLPR
jgi:glycosyltransferase involved in cell wall biosynthesis